MSFNQVQYCKFLYVNQKLELNIIITFDHVLQTQLTQRLASCLFFIIYTKIKEQIDAVTHDVSSELMR